MSGNGEMTLRFASFDHAWKQCAAMPIDLCARAVRPVPLSRHRLFRVGAHS
jgi:hypothetical protein